MEQNFGNSIRDLTPEYHKELEEAITGHLLGTYQMIRLMGQQGTFRTKTEPVTEHEHAYWDMVIAQCRPGTGELRLRFLKFLLAGFCMIVQQEPGHPAGDAVSRRDRVELIDGVYYCPVREKAGDVDTALCPFCPGQQTPAVGTQTTRETRAGAGNRSLSITATGTIISTGKPYWQKETGWHGCRHPSGHLWAEPYYPDFMRSAGTFAGRKDNSSASLSCNLVLFTVFGTVLSTCQDLSLDKGTGYTLRRRYFCHAASGAGRRQPIYQRLFKYLVMEQEKIQFTVAIIIGFVVMILFGIITVNIMQLIPIFGPFVGGIVAGIIAGKNFLNGAKAALIAGLLGAVAVSVDFIANTLYVTMAVPQYFQIFGVFFLVISLFYFSILAFLGGALGGALGVMIGTRPGNLPVQEKKA